MKSVPKINITQLVCALRHIETGEFICLRNEGQEYLACFTDGDSAIQFREELGLLEHVDVATMPLSELPFDHFWFDGEMVDRASVLEAAAQAL